MELIRLILIAIAAFAVAGHLVLWFIVYQHTTEIEKWSRQADALISPWWLFNKTLLPAEHDHFRQKALWCFVVYVFAGAAAWYLS
jgi:hypothetical protein